MIDMTGSADDYSLHSVISPQKTQGKKEFRRQKSGGGRNSEDRSQETE
jgi:hypothetical protein